MALLFCRSLQLLQRTNRGLAGRVWLAQREFSSASLSEVLGQSHEEAYRQSLTQPESFWGELARKRLRWTRPFVNTMSCDVKAGKIRWFEGGALNVSGKDRRTVEQCYCGEEGEGARGSSVLVWRGREGLIISLCLFLFDIRTSWLQHMQ